MICTGADPQLGDKNPLQQVDGSSFLLNRQTNFSISYGGIVAKSAYLGSFVLSSLYRR